MSAPCPALAFFVTVRLTENATESDAHRLLVEFTELLDRHDLAAVGRGQSEREYLIRREGSQATDDDRSFVRDWASQWTAIASIEVGDIVDVSDTG